MRSSLVFVALLSSVLASPLRSRQSSSAISAVTPDQWQALSDSVGGRLYQGQPMARPCFALASAGTNGNADAGQCTDAQNGWKNDLAIVEYFGGYLEPNWGSCQATGEQCQLDFTAPQNPLAYSPPQQCSQGSVSPYYIDATQPSDIQAALNFSKATKVPLVVKNSGHDYKGRSSAPNSLGLWVHHLNSAPEMKTNFVAAGCSDSTPQAVTFGAGVGFLELYQWAEDNDVTVVGGSSETVVAGGGWISGGGHSALSNTLGLGADRTLEMTVVTPNGELVTASRCQNPDLFFALRGGGAGAFGVHVSVTMAVAPKLTLQAAYVKFVSADPDVVSKFLGLCIQQGLLWSQHGWGGYIEVAAATSQANGFVLVTPSLSYDEAVEDMKPITDYVASLGNIATNNGVTTYDSFFQFYNAELVPNEEVVGVNTVIGSRFVPKESFATNSSRDALLDAFMKGIATVGTNLVSLTSPGLIYGGAPVQILVTAPSSYTSDGTASVTPQWYDTVWHVLFAPTWTFSASPAAVKGYFAQANAAAQPLRDITPEGAYQNEANPYEPNPVAAFWGQANYDRLLSIKQSMDPDNVLTGWGAIGWDSSDPRYACYPGQ